MEELRSSSTSFWSDLPKCLLELILNRLKLLDLHRFRSVCRSWRACAPQLPLLALPHRSIIYFLCLSDKITYEAPVPSHLISSPWTAPLYFFRTFVCISSSHGWLLLCLSYHGIGDVFKYYFYNPFNRRWVHLPRPTECLFYTDCLFFSTPSYPNGVLFVRRSNGSFMLCRLDDPRRHLLWSIYHHHPGKAEDRFVLSNTIFFEGKLYALNKLHLSLWIVDPLFPVTSTARMEMDQSGFEHTFPWHNRKEYSAWVLVESRGEILMVRVTVAEGFAAIKGVDVFRADLTEKAWVKVESLGDRMLFLSETSSVSVSTEETGCKGNCIYYSPGKLANGILYFKYEMDGNEQQKVVYNGGMAFSSSAWITPRAYPLIQALNAPSFPSCSELERERYWPFSSVQCEEVMALAESNFHLIV